MTRAFRFHGILLTIVTIAVFLTVVQTASATEFHIGGNATAPNYFPTLEELRASGQLASGDKIFLYKDDHSLTRHFEFGVGTTNLTIQSGTPGLRHTISLAPGAAAQGYGGVLNNPMSSSLISLTLDDVVLGGNRVETANARGGAIYANSLTLDGASSVFTGNSATDGSGDYSGHGGAIWASTLTLDGASSVFTGNSATGGSDDYSGFGGAIRTDHMTVTGGNHLFSGNRAVGGSGIGSGLGGAICARHGDMNLSGNLLFLNNSATTANLSDPTGGLGGAIFHNLWGANRDFKLSTGAGETILFRGNTQQNGPNAIYFGNTVGGGAHGTTTAKFHTDTGSQILMFDPMESQVDGLYDSNVTLNLEKTGGGLWLLGGESNLNGAATVTISGGTFQLDRDAQLNLNHGTTADFSIASGAIFMPTVNGPGSVSTVHARTVDLQAGSLLEVAGISSLAAGDTRFAGAVTSTDSTTNAMGSHTPTSGAMFTRAEYVAGSGNDLDLQITGLQNMCDVFGTDPFLDVYRQRLSLNPIQRGILDEIYDTGVYDPRIENILNWKYVEEVKGNTVLNATGAHLITARMFSQSMLKRLQYRQATWRRPVTRYSDGLYRGQSCDTACRNTTVWGEFTQNWSTQTDSGNLAGYDYKPFALTFGKERQAGRWVLGLAGQYSHGEAKGGRYVWTDDTLDTASLGVYGGWFGSRNYLIGDMQFGVGWNKEDSYDSFSGSKTHGSFHSAALGAGLEFGRTYSYFCEVNPLTITPHVGADYWFLNREAFDETGPNARSFGSANYNVVEIPVGVRIARNIPMTGGKANWITPSVDLIYARSLADDAPVSTASFIGLPLVWNARGADLGRDIFRMNTALTGRYCNRVDVGIGYELEARNHYTSQQLNAMIAFSR